MRINYVILAFLFMLCSCTSANDAEQYSDATDVLALLPTSIDKLLITDMSSDSLKEVYGDELKNRLLWVFNNSEAIEDPQLFNPVYQLIIDDNELLIENDIYYFMNQCFYKENMQTIIEQFYLDEHFWYVNALNGAKPQISIIEMQWLELGEPFLNVSWSDQETINGVFTELINLEANLVAFEPPQHFEMQLSNDTAAILRYNQGILIINNMCYRIPDSLALEELLWSSDRAAELFAEKVKESLLGSEVSLQKFPSEEWQSLSTVCTTKISEFFQINRIIYGGYHKETDAQYQIKVNCGSIRDLQLGLLSEDMLEVNGINMFIKYSHELWDYLINTFPNN